MYEIVSVGLRVSCWTWRNHPKSETSSLFPSYYFIFITAVGQCGKLWEVFLLLLFDALIFPVMSWFTLSRSYNSATSMLKYFQYTHIVLIIFSYYCHLVWESMSQVVLFLPVQIEEWEPSGDLNQCTLYRAMQPTCSCLSSKLHEKNLSRSTNVCSYVCRCWPSKRGKAQDMAWSLSHTVTDTHGQVLSAASFFRALNNNHLKKS